MTDQNTVPPTFCPNCGRIIAPDWEICPDCGTTIRQSTPSQQSTAGTHPPHWIPVEPEPAIRCKKCGRPLKKGWESCPDCGTLVDDDAPQQPPVPPVSSKTGPSMRSNSNRGWMIGLGVAVVALLCLFVASLLLGIGAYTTQKELETQVDSLQQTSTQAAIRVETELEKMESTQVAMEAAKLAQEQAFLQTSVAREENYQATFTAQESNMQATLSAFQFENAYILYGPSAGSLPHVDDTFIEVEWTDIDITNGIVEATFTNPYDPSFNAWDYGFMFRNTGTNLQYRLFVYSDGTWHLTFAQGDDRPEVASGDLTNLNLGEGDKNIIRLIFTGGNGSLFINNVFISTLDLSGKIESGGLAIGTGFYSGNEVEGYSTTYSDFTVWELP